MAIIVEVAKNFSEVVGLKRKDSDFSAEKLREDILQPAIRDLKPTERFIVVLDDKRDSSAYQYSAAYLQEAFVGLVTYGFMSYSEFIHTVAFECHHKENEFYIDRIFKYNKEKQALKGENQ